MSVAADARHSASRAEGSSASRAEGSSASRAGRPRDPHVDVAIRAATLELLVEDGYQATTIQAIARRAGVSAPSIYRRWSSKAELVEAAVFPSDLVEPASAADDLAGELVDYCRRIMGYLAQPAVRAAIPGLLTEYQTDPQMWDRLMARTLMPMRRSFEAFVTRSGHEPATSVDALFEVMMGAMFARALNVGAADADEFAESVALVALSTLRPATNRRRRRFERPR